MKEGEDHLKNKKLKRTAIFIGIFLAAILLTFVLARIFRAPPEPEPATTEVTTTAEATSLEGSTAEEESTTEFEWNVSEPTTTTSTSTSARNAKTTKRSNTSQRQTTTKPKTVPRTTISSTRTTTTTRAPVTTKPPATTTRASSTKITTTRSATTISATDSLIAYGVNYGKSISLIYRPQLTQGGTAVLGATQQSVRAKLDQAKAAGKTVFNVWREGNTIYISAR